MSFSSHDNTNDFGCSDSIHPEGKFSRIYVLLKERSEQIQELFLLVDGKNNKIKVLEGSSKAKDILVMKT